MLDETCVTTILARHFPTAQRDDISDAVRELILLELLADDRLVVWEDSLRDCSAPGQLQVFGPPLPKES